MLAARLRGKGLGMEDDRSNERTETDERVAENLMPAERVPVTRDDTGATDPSTGLPRGTHDDDGSPLDRGKQLDPFGGNAPGDHR